VSLCSGWRLCIELELAPARKQEIACTRSFGRSVTRLADLDEAITEFASRAAHKLRGQGSLAGQVLVFVRTSPFRIDAQFSRSISVPLRRPSADTGVIVAAALRGLRAIYRPGYQLASAGLLGSGQSGFGKKDPWIARNQNRSSNTSAAWPMARTTGSAIPHPSAWTTHCAKSWCWRTRRATDWAAIARCL